MEPDIELAVCGRRSGLGALDETPVFDLLGIGGRSGLPARVGAAVESAVPGSEGIGERAPGVGGSLSWYRDTLDARLLRRLPPVGLGALLDAAVRVDSAPGVEGNRVGVENPVPGIDRDILGLAATCWWSLMEVLCSVSKSVIHCATGNRWTELRALMSARVSVEEASADWMADLNWRTKCFGAMDW